MPSSYNTKLLRGLFWVKQSKLLKVRRSLVYYVLSVKENVFFLTQNSLRLMKCEIKFVFHPLQCTIFGVYCDKY
jgi:hypothetical protein